MAEKEKKVKLFPNQYCDECKKDPTVRCPRGPDVQCLHCGAKVCGYHVKKHLHTHLVSTEWTGI